MLLLDEETRATVLAQARDSLDEVIANLDNSRSPLDELDPDLPGRIGVERAAAGVHPTESVQAAQEFFAATIDQAMACLEQDENSPMARVALALNWTIMLRIRQAASAYTGFLIDKIHRIQLDERQHLARNLHDRIGAMIGMSYRQLELCSMYQEADPAMAGEKVEIAMQSLTQVMNEIRQLTAEFRLVEPQGGLRQALVDYAHAVKSADESINVLINGDERWIPETARDEIFLVLREALRNATQHGQPRCVVVCIDIAPHELRATVEDDGHGFQVDQPTNNGIGIRSMQERIALLGGHFRLASSPGRGTKVEVWVPLQGRGAAGA
jgi:signal transduction histidine kinase